MIYLLITEIIISIYPYFKYGISEIILDIARVLAKIIKIIRLIYEWISKRRKTRKKNNGQGIE